MSKGLFDIGDAPRLLGSFSDIDFVPIDPSTVTFKIKDPAGVVTTLVYSFDGSVIKQDTGIYYTDFSVNTDGVHNWKLFGTGSGQVAEQASFEVRSSNV